MHAWEQIQITVDYIEEHTSEEIKIENLAKLASLSQFYYQRLLARLVKKPVMEYVKLRRLQKHPMLYWIKAKEFWISLWILDFPLTKLLHEHLRMRLE